MIIHIPNPLSLFKRKPAEHAESESVLKVAAPQAWPPPPAEPGKSTLDLVTAALETSHRQIEQVKQQKTAETTSSEPPITPAQADEESTMATPALIPAHETLVQKIEGVEKKTLGVLEAVAKDADKGLAFAVKYLPEAATIAAAVYPPSAAIDASVISATDLIQKAVANAEVQYASATPSDATNSQKLATVVTLAENAVTALLAKAGIKADTEYVTNLVNAVVAILKVQTTTVAA